MNFQSLTHESTFERPKRHQTVVVCLNSHLGKQNQQFACFILSRILEFFIEQLFSSRRQPKQKRGWDSGVIFRATNILIGQSRLLLLIFGFGILFVNLATQPVLLATNSKFINNWSVFQQLQARLAAENPEKEATATQVQINKQLYIAMHRQIIHQGYTQPRHDCYTLEAPAEAPNSVNYGFSGRVFPLTGFLVGVISIIASYEIARHKSPPDVPPFPQTDITHTGIHYPEYIFLRIGLMVAAPLFCISFQILKNYLEIKCFEILGHANTKLNSFGPISIASCVFLAVSTATISDGGDMNWTVHTIGATGFFILAILLILKASKIYRALWSAQHNFCPAWSYQIKKYSNFILASIFALLILDAINVISIGSFVEWYATFYLLVFFATLYWDLDGMQIVLFKA